MGNEQEDNKLLYADILSLLQIQIDELSKTMYESDTRCPPKFTLSIGEEYLMFNNTYQGRHGTKGKSKAPVDCIMLTIEHLGEKFTEQIFPRMDCQYGYEALSSIMSGMYNRTM